MNDFQLSHVEWRREGITSYELRITKYKRRMLVRREDGASGSRALVVARSPGAAGAGAPGSV